MLCRSTRPGSIAAFLLTALLLAAPGARADSVSGSGAANAASLGASASGSAANRTVTVTPTTFAAASAVALTISASNFPVSQGGDSLQLQEVGTLAPNTSAFSCGFSMTSAYCDGSDTNDLAQWPPSPLPSAYSVTVQLQANDLEPCTTLDVILDGVPADLALPVTGSGPPCSAPPGRQQGSSSSVSSPEASNSSSTAASGPSSSAGSSGTSSATGASGPGASSGASSASTGQAGAAGSGKVTVTCGPSPSASGSGSYAVDGKVTVGGEIAIAVPCGASGQPQPAPKPTLEAVSPASGTEAGGQQVTLGGAGFSSATVVDVGTVSVPFTIVSDNEIDITIEAGQGTVPITVSGPSGQSDPVAAGTYTYEAPAASAPAAASAIPASASTTTLTAAPAAAWAAVRGYLREIGTAVGRLTSTLAGLWPGGRHGG